MSKKEQKSKPQKSFFIRFANATSTLAGRPATFILMASLVIVWAVCGPVFDFSETWQLVINTSTTIITFLMVFVIQNTQNREGYAVQLKLDEIIRAIEGAHNELLDIEELDEDHLCRMRDRYEQLASKARERIKQKSAQDDEDFLEDLEEDQSTAIR